MWKVHHETLRVIYQSDESYENLLNLDSIVSLHQRHLRFLVTKIFKSVSKTNPEFISFYFSYKNVLYNLERGPALSLPFAKSTLCGTNSVHFKGTVNLPYFVKSSVSVSEFKINLKILGSIDCSCHICKN